MKKFFGIFATVLLCVFALSFIGCGNVSVEIANDISTKVKACQTYLNNNVFSKTSGTDFDNSTSESYVKDEDFYIEVANNVPSSVSIIKIGEVIYEIGKDSEYSVGNTNTLTRKSFMINDNKMFIASLTLLLNANQNGMTKVSFPNDKINAFEFNVYETGENNLRGELVSQGTGELTGTNEMYSFKSNQYNNSIFVKLKNQTEDIAQTDIVITERVVCVGENNQSKIYGYGKADSPVGQEGYGVVFYPAYNNGQEYTPTTPQSHKLQFNVYCVGVGSFHFLMEFQNITTT